MKEDRSSCTTTGRTSSTMDDVLDEVEAVLRARAGSPPGAGAAVAAGGAEADEDVLNDEVVAL